jgi:hypothetical protein
VVYEGIQDLLAADQPKFARAAAFADHCLTLRDASGLVAATRFEPKNIPKLAPYIVILGAIENGADFLIRLVGTKLVAEFFGADPTGAMLSSVLGDDEYARRSRHIVDCAFRQQKPVLNQPGRTRWREKNYMLLETVTFPLIGADGAVAKIVSLYDYRLEKDDNA